uniref:Odorant receptor n=1 Tax=Phlebotomus papatasi TaxID=29031 RepID=A0A3F2ZEC2_PHLPP
MSQEELILLHQKVINFHRVFINWASLNCIYQSAGRNVQRLKLTFVPLYCVTALLFCVYTAMTTDNQISLFYCIIIAVCFYQCCFKFYCFMVAYRGDFTKMLEYMEFLTKPTDLPFADEIRGLRLRRNIKFILWFTKMFVAASNSIACIVTLYALSETNYCCPLFFKIPSFIIEEENYLKRPISIIFSCVAYFILVQIMMCSDSVFFMILAYFEGNLTALVEVIQHLNDTETAKKDACKILRYVYEYHCDVLIHLRIFRRIYWHLNIHFITTNFIAICLLLFMSRFYESPIATYLGAGTAIFQLFFVCFCGQILRNRTEAIGDALYHTRWYEMNRREKITVLIIMTAGQEPIGLDAGGIMPISFNTFANVSGINPITF